MCSAAGRPVAAGLGSRVRVNIHTRAGGGSGSRRGTVSGVPSHIKGERSGQVCGGGCGRLCRCRFASRGRGRHREAGNRVTSGSSASAGVCITECVVSIDNRGGDIGSHVDSYIITHIMGDRGVIGRWVSLVIYAHVQRLGGNLVLLFVFIDVREMIPYHYLRVPLAVGQPESYPGRHPLPRACETPVNMAPPSSTEGGTWFCACRGGVVLYQPERSLLSLPQEEW